MPCDQRKYWHRNVKDWTGCPANDLLTFSKNREVWQALLDVTSIHVLPPATGARQGTTD